MTVVRLNLWYPFNLISGYPQTEGYTAAALGTVDVYTGIGSGMSQEVGADPGLDPEAAKDLLLYAPGSGTGNTMPFNAVSTRWLSEGPAKERIYMTTQWSGSLMLADPDDPASIQRRLTRPSRYGYGNVNSPAFVSGFTMGAHHIRGLLQVITYIFPNLEKITLFGQSSGATAILAYLAGFAGDEPVDPRIVGAFLNAPTQAGLGTGSWNNPARLTNSFSQLFGLPLARRTLVAYADNDLYAPPDMARRYQAACPNDAETYFVSPGAVGHNWMSDVANQDLVMQWIYQVHNEETFTLRDGVTPALPGATGVL